MNCIVKTSLGILLLIVLINGDIKFDDKCQVKLDIIKIDLYEILLSLGT